MPGIAKVMARETNRYAKKFLENMPNLELKSRTHHWAGIENYTIIKYSWYLLLELQQCFWWYKRFSDDFIVCEDKDFAMMFEKTVRFIHSFIHTSLELAKEVQFLNPHSNKKLCLPMRHT
jgi:hypothetical protein